MTWVARQFWPLLKPFIASWLVTRALVVPAAKRAEICARAEISDAEFSVVQAALQQSALLALETFKP